MKAAFEALKKSGKIRFAGFSCHDAMLPELMDAGTEAGWLDQFMIKYNFRDVGGTRPLRRASALDRQGRRRPTSAWSP